MIIGFRHKGLKVFYLTGSTRGISVSHAAKLARILAALDAAAAPDELDLPSFKLHPLKGKSKDFWAIWVNGNWRVAFHFIGADVELVDYLDYH
jgi:proteic killer suppression protein